MAWEINEVFKTKTHNTHTSHNESERQTERDREIDYVISHYEITERKTDLTKENSEGKKLQPW